MAGSVSNWLEALRAGDELAAQQLWNRYYARLVGFARSQLRLRRQSVSSEEDVACSVFESFFRCMEAGRFPAVTDRDNLWRLLLFIAARKAARLARDGSRKKRSPPQSVRTEINGHDPLIDVVDRGPTPDLAIECAETLRELMGALGEGQLQQLVIYKMEGYSNSEIAERLDCSRATVERKLRRIRHEWSRRADLYR